MAESLRQVGEEPRRQRHGPTLSVLPARVISVERNANSDVAQANSDVAEREQQLAAGQTARKGRLSLALNRCSSSLLKQCLSRVGPFLLLLTGALLLS